MSYGLDRCSILGIKRGKQVESTGIELPGDDKNWEVEVEGYKYLGIFTLDTKMKDNITAEYFRRDKVLCKSKR